MLTGACQFGHSAGGFTTNFIHPHWAGEPTSRRHAATPPSHRADEPPSARAPGKRSHLARKAHRTHPTTIPDAPRECSITGSIPTPPCSAFHPPSSPAHSQRFAIRSGQSQRSHPGLQTHLPPARKQLKSHRLHATRQPDRFGRVRAVRNSPSDITPCRRVVQRRTCSPVTRRSTRATQARARAAPGAWGSCRPTSPKTPSEASYEARNEPEECLRSTMAGRCEHCLSRNATNITIWLRISASSIKIENSRKQLPISH